MKTTLTTIAIATILLSAASASADEPTTARPAAARSAVRAQRSSAARTARTTARAATAEAPTSTSSSLIRGFGSCAAASFEELAVEIGRLAAMEECTSRGNPSAAARELSRTAPRQTDLGIPEEAFDAGFEVSGL